PVAQDTEAIGTETCSARASHCDWSRECIAWRTCSPARASGALSPKSHATLPQTSRAASRVQPASDRSIAGSTGRNDLMQVLRFCVPPGAAPVTAAAGALALAAASAAQAQDCSAKTNPVYVAGSSAAKPFLGAVAQALAGQSTPITLVYQSLGSCVGVSD